MFGLRELRLAGVRLGGIARVLGIAAACLGALYPLSLLARVYAGRVHYSWDVEWLESSVLYQSYRVMHGLPTYGPFEGGYIPLAHPPGYPVILALLGHVFGLSHAMARTVSLLLVAASAVIVARAVMRHHGRSLDAVGLAALAVGWAAAGAPVCAGVYDLAREDALALFLTILAAALADPGASVGRGRIVALALTITAMGFTRQTTVFFAAWIVVFVLLRDRRAGVRLALVTAFVYGGCLAALQLSSWGTYWFLTVTLLRHQPVFADRLVYAAGVVLRFAPFLAAVPLVVAALAIAPRVVRFASRDPISARSVLWLGMLAASLPASLLPFAKRGGFENDFMPVVFIAGPATAFVVSDLVRALARLPALALVVQTLLFTAGAASLCLHGHDVARSVPGAVQFERARALDAKVAALQGGVLCPRAPFTPVGDGHDTLQWSEMPYLDMQWSGFSHLDLGGYIERADARWALVTGTELPGTVHELATRYRLDETIPEGPETIIGDPSQVRYLLRHDDELSSRPEAPSAVGGPHVVFDFEGELAGWRQTGDTFQIVPARPAWQNPIDGVVGERLVSSYHPIRRDQATGTLTSPTFVIDRPYLALRVSGSRPATRVELRVRGATVRTASGVFAEKEMLVKVVWSVAALQGEPAELVLVDEDTGSWGHLLVDQVVLRTSP